MSDQEVKIPEDLHNIVQNSIQTGLTRRKARQRQNRLTAISAAAVCCTFLFFFQTNAVFAKTVMDLPIVSRIARLFLASDSQTEEISYIADIKIPQLENNDQAEALNSGPRKDIRPLFKLGETKRIIFRTGFQLIISYTAITINICRLRFFPPMSGPSPVRRLIVTMWKPEPAVP